MTDWTLHLGDCLDVLPTLPDGSVDAVITDPPYSSGGMFRGDRVNGTTDEKYTHEEHRGKRPNYSGDNMDQRAWALFGRLWMAEARRATREGGYLCCFTDWRQLPTLTDVVQHAGWVWRGVLIWDKTEAAKAPHLGYFGYQCEFIVWATNGPCLQRPALAEGGEGRMPGCFRRAVSRADKFHQAGKPTDVMAWLVRCCPPGGVVLDPFCGSATTGVACIQSGRRFVGVESNPDYHPVARNRLEEVHGPLFAASPVQGVMC
jgi:site-specific DNA-methyltransferase (adenine-specific)